MANLLGWILSLGLMAAVAIVNHPLQQLDTKSRPMEFGLYDGISRVAWSMSLCFIIFSCTHNSGGPINWFLSHRFWQPLSRLCYSIYLLHVPVIVIMTATMKRPIYFNILGSLQQFIEYYLITVFISIVATLTFESPFIIIEKLIFGSNPKTTSKILEKQNGIKEKLT